MSGIRELFKNHILASNCIGLALFLCWIEDLVICRYSHFMAFGGTEALFLGMGAVFLLVSFLLIDIDVLHRLFTIGNITKILYWITVAFFGLTIVCHIVFWENIFIEPAGLVAFSGYLAGMTYLWERALFGLQNSRLVGVNLGVSGSVSCALTLFLQMAPIEYRWIISSLLAAASLVVIWFTVLDIEPPEYVYKGKHSEKNATYRRLVISEVTLSVAFFMAFGNCIWYAVSPKGSDDFPMVIGAGLAVGFLVIFFRYVSNDQFKKFHSVVFYGSIILWFIAQALQIPAFVNVAAFLLCAVFAMCVSVHVENIEILRQFVVTKSWTAYVFFIACDCLSFTVGCAFGYCCFDAFVDNLSIQGMLNILLLGIMFLFILVCERLVPSEFRTAYLNLLDEGVVDHSADLPPVLSLSDPVTTLHHDSLVTEESSSFDAQQRADAAADTLESISKMYGLSARETEVLELLIKGHNASGISKRLYVSIPTVKTHIHNAYSKLDLHSQQAVIDFYEELLLERLNEK